MRHLRLFEEKPWNDIEGEYVVLTYHKKYNDFLENNIGVVKKAYYPGSWFDVEYNNPTEVIKKFLKSKGDNFHITNVLFRSKNREECEAYLTSKKYNI